MADNPVPQLGNKTPLQYANIPTMDELASAGVLGSVRTVPEGVAAGSDSALLSIFGCDPRDYFAGRAALEAAASGIKLVAGDVAYRCNMVSYEDGGMAFEERKILSHSAGSIEGELADKLVTALFDSPAFKAAAEKAGMAIYPGTSFRHIAAQKNPDIKGIKLYPPHDYLGEVIGPLLPSGCENAKVLKELMGLAFEFLNTHPENEARRARGELPANGIWFWAEGETAELPKFADRYGKTGGIISAVPLCHGIGVLLGLEKITVEGATGELHTNYEGKVEATLEVLRTNPFSTVHVEAPDECTHNGDTEGKLQAIEWIDSRVVAPLLRRLKATGEDFRMLIMADHKTLTSTRGHDGSPVPFIIYDSRQDRQTGLRYCEQDAEQGVFIPDGTNLMDLLFENKELVV